MTQAPHSRSGRAATILAAVIALPLLYLVFAELAVWAQAGFARSFLASCLLAIIELALFAVAVALWPAVSLLFAKALGALARRR